MIYMTPAQIAKAQEADVLLNLLAHNEIDYIEFKLELAIVIQESGGLN